MNIWVIYDRPKDYPEHYVLRRWRVLAGQTVPDRKPTAISLTLSELRKFLPLHSVKIDNRYDPDPSILEVWI